MAICGFHPEALLEYDDATNYYLREASVQVAEAFITAVETAVAHIGSAPTRWRVVDAPDIRRYVFRRFPYLLYYRWESDKQRVTVYAVMHCSREPGYWKKRVS